MSLVPYKEGSVILDDPTSRSLVIVYPSNGSLEFFEKVFDTENGQVDPSRKPAARASIASFVCPQCGTEVTADPSTDRNDTLDIMKETSASRQLRSRSGLSRKYFKLLESSHRHYSLGQEGRPALAPQHQFFLPDNLFIPGYFHKFFKTLCLLGSGARGSVYKVVHRIGDIELGVFALKKIPIGNDMKWFQKCIREVKALSSLTNRSANLITYNHVWLEMDTACGLVRTVDGRQSETVENIPCIFILQQYCSGGNLEDFILREVFQRFQDIESREERKKKFLHRRNHPDEEMGLTTQQITFIIKDLATGLQELHDIGLIHRDLKPSNCLLLEKNVGDQPLADYFPTIIIGDLGECQMDGESRAATGATGTLEFTAPEVIISGTSQRKPTNYNEYTFASDVYSLGMICYFMVFGELPFESQLEIDQLKLSISGFKLDKPLLIKKHEQMRLKSIDGRIFDLMELLLSRNVTERPTAAEVVFFLEDLIENKCQVESMARHSSNELELLQDELAQALKVDDLSEEHVDQVIESSGAASKEKPQQTFRRYRKIFCIAINMAFTMVTLSWSKGSILSQLSLVLLGASLKSSLNAQKWILVSLGLILIMARHSGGFPSIPFTQTL